MSVKLLSENNGIPHHCENLRRSIEASYHLYLIIDINIDRLNRYYRVRSGGVVILHSHDEQWIYSQ